MEKLFYISSVLVCVLVAPSLEKEIELNIGTLIPYSMLDLYGHKRAIEFAAETVKNQSLLKGYKLVFHHKDTYFAPATAIQSLIELRALNSSNAVKICIIGPAVSKVAVHTGQLATIWGTLQVSYGASSLELMADTYTKFLTMVPTSNSRNRAMIELMNFFEWRRVGVAYDRDVNLKSFYLPTMNALRDNLKASNVDILVEEGIDSTKNHKTIFIQSLKEKDVRIVIALLANDNLVSLLCEAFKQNFYGDNIVWFTYSSSLKFKTDKNYGCNKTEFDTVSEGMFFIDIQFFRTDMNKTRSGLTVRDFKKRIMDRHPHKYTMQLNPRYSIAFDTVWLLALSLNDDLESATRMQNPSIDKNDYLNLANKLRESMKKQDFEGISGRVKFNSSERLGTIVIKQKRKEGVISVAQHHTFSNVLTFFPNQSKPEILFKGTKYVQDGPRHINETRHYSLILFVVIWIVCALAVIIAVALFYFNFKNREIRYIKMSSPHVNNIIIFGGLLCYIKVFLDTLDSRFVDLQTYGHFCNARVWLMSLGFTTAFGAMFSKTWRVHRIFTASKNFRRAVIKNFHLYGLLFALLGVDCILLTAWMIISPYESGILELPAEENKEEDEVIHPYIFNCTSLHENYFLLTTCAYKGLLLVFGIFLAWETRNIEIKALNDSKYIGISVYNVVILSVVGVILATLMSGSAYYNVYLVLMSVVVILCTAATLGIVFVPKIIGLQRIVNSTGNESLETTYSVKSSDGSPTSCCCCEACKCRCSGAVGRERKASIHVSNKFLAGASSNRRKSRTASVPSISVTKPKVSVHINARVSLSTYPISESPTPSPDESPRAGFLSNNEA